MLKTGCFPISLTLLNPMPLYYGSWGWDRVLSIGKVGSLWVMYQCPTSGSAIVLGCQGNGLGGCPPVPAVWLAGSWSLGVSWAESTVGVREAVTQRV